MENILTFWVKHLQDYPTVFSRNSVIENMHKNGHVCVPINFIYKNTFNRTDLACRHSWLTFAGTFFFLGPHPWHMEVPKLGFESELQMPAYATATAAPDLSHICDLHHSSWQCRILNPLSEARDRTGNLLVPSQICHHGTMTGTPLLGLQLQELCPQPLGALSHVYYFRGTGPLFSQLASPLPMHRHQPVVGAGSLGGDQAERLCWA